MTDTQTRPKEPGAAVLSVARFFRPGTPVPDLHAKYGIATWETQETDRPSVSPDRPEYEPRCCLRGAPFARGKGGLIPASWDAAVEIVAAAPTHTFRTCRPDSIAGFSPFPAMAEARCPLHPEYRTMPVAWYIPPPSPVVDSLSGSGSGHDGEDAENLSGAIDTLRISPEKLPAMRSHMRALSLGEEPGASVVAAAGMKPEESEAMYRLRAVAECEDRCVIPTATVGDARRPEETAISGLRAGCSLDHDGGPGMGDGPFGQDSGRRSLPLVSVENFHSLRRRQTSNDPADAKEI
ncbi:hypothetical protein AV521_28120 [Streptomyces sp. IMTB 2501]|nr:hypothetical protein AV521_28120 [Streptomyces sp. IMTB 2501]